MVDDEWMDMRRATIGISITFRSFMYNTPPTQPAAEAACMMIEFGFTKIAPCVNSSEVKNVSESAFMVFYTSERRRRRLSANGNPGDTMLYRDRLHRSFGGKDRMVNDLVKMAFSTCT